MTIVKQQRQPFQLLEINVISAQDLEPVSKKMKTYAIAWVHPKRKLATRVDSEGRNNPTWNDKFVFRVDEEFLHRDMSSVMIEIYAANTWFRDTLIGSVRVLVGNLIPPVRTHHNQHQHVGMRFVALQVRRASGRPQGILNIGVALLDSSMRSMPLYTQLSASAVGLRDLMEEEDLHHHNSHNQQNNPSNVNPILRRSKSERSERMGVIDNLSITNSSIVGMVPKDMLPTKGGSVLSSIERYDPLKSKNLISIKGKKASSVISGAELREPKGKKGKSGSVVSDSIVSKNSSSRDRRLNLITKAQNFGEHNVTNEKPGAKKENNETSGEEKVVNEKPGPELSDEKSVTRSSGAPPPRVPVFAPAIGKPKSKVVGPSLGTSKFIFGGPHKANSLLWTDSEVGPSPSEVAAAVARKYPRDDNESSVLDGWSLDESVEGLRSKLERWRTELPPLYDRGYSSSSFGRSTTTGGAGGGVGGGGGGKHSRRHTDGGSGMFSCFGNICGYECQCICGRPPANRILGSQFHSPSIGASAGRSFI